jgi:hypothetical protein
MTGVQVEGVVRRGLMEVSLIIDARDREESERGPAKATGGCYLEED